MGERHRLDEVLLEARLDGGLDLLDLADDAFDLDAGRARQQRDQRAGPGRIPGRCHVGEIAIGDEPEDHRVGRVDLAPERAGEPDLVDRLHPEVIHQQPDARVERGLGQLDRPDVVLGHGDARPAVDALAEDVAEGPSIGDHARRARHERPVDDAVLGDDAREEELGDHLDDARAADAGHAQLVGRGREARFVRPQVRADDLEPRLERRGVDADALDRARRGALAAADLGALEGRPGRAGGGEQPVGVAEDDLRVRADVDDQVDPVRGPVRRLGEDDPGRVRADVTRDARQDVDARARMGGQAELGRADRGRPGRWPGRTAPSPAGWDRCRARGDA